jgi:ferric-dicitrate binding protein FerR (iron transport regulator)
VNTARAFRSNNVNDLPQTFLYRLRRLTALSLAATVLNLSAAVSFAAPPGASAALGTLRVSGVVTVNDLRALSGQTILSNSHIITASKSISILELGNFTRLIMSEQTEFALDFSATSVMGSLRHGEVRVFMPAARTLTIETPDGVIATDSSQTAVLSLEVKPGFTHISIETGRAELRVGKSRRVLAAGETFLTDCDGLAMPAPLPHIGTTGRVGIFAGIGVGLASLLTAITGRKPKEVLDFGGCVIAPSGSNDNPGMCG